MFTTHEGDAIYLPSPCESAIDPLRLAATVSRKWDMDSATYPADLIIDFLHADRRFDLQREASHLPSLERGAARDFHQSEKSSERQNLPAQQDEGNGLSA